MACIGKIRGDLTMACGAPAPTFNRIIGAKVLNASDIVSFTVAAENGGVAITRAPGTRAYELTGINNALTVTVGMKSQDVMPGAFDVTATIKNFSATSFSGVASSNAPFGIVNEIARAEIVLAVSYEGGAYRIFGLGAPLVCLEYNLDSTENGYPTVTYGVEDWQVGTTVHWISKNIYDALGNPAPKPAG